MSLPLDKLHCTRFNPRRNFGTDEELREFGEKLNKEQLQPAVVVSRAAYRGRTRPTAWASLRTSLPMGSGATGLHVWPARPALEVVHREDVARDRATFLDAVQSENNDRQDPDPIERAIAIETMVTELGGAEQVAKPRSSSGPRQPDHGADARGQVYHGKPAARAATDHDRSRGVC
ncbi:hypothetical protein [Streptomyces griseoluteus]|uniref:hypothetical protein n=1 Tax=Streptomyces griseoluteus TaxID=29306 RepID=UPI0036F76B24